MSHELSLTDKTAQAIALAQAIKDMVVLNAEGHIAMEGMRKQSRKMLDALDLEYKQDPRYVAFHELQAQKLALEKLLKGINTGGKDKQMAWEQAEEVKRLESEAALAAQLKKDAEDAAIAQAEANPEQADAILETVTVPAVVLPKTAPATRSQVRWSYRIVDANKIPRQFLKPDEVAIGRVVTALKGASRIEGIEVFSRKV